MISIIQYSGARTEEIEEELHKREIRYQLAGEKDDIHNSKGIILPDGIGSFQEMMQSLKKSGLADKLQAWGRLGLPLFAYGLGFKALFTSYEVDHYYQGLHLLAGRVVSSSQLAESIGKSIWLHLEDPHPLLQGCFEEKFFLSSSEMVLADNREDVLCALEPFREAAIIIARAKILGFLGTWNENATLAEKLLVNFLLQLVSRSRL